MGSSAIPTQGRSAWRRRPRSTSRPTRTSTGSRRRACSARSGGRRTSLARTRLCCRTVGSPAASTRWTVTPPPTSRPATTRLATRRRACSATSGGRRTSLARTRLCCRTVGPPAESTRWIGTPPPTSRPATTRLTTRRRACSARAPAPAGRSSPSRPCGWARRRSRRRARRSRSRGRRPSARGRGWRSTSSRRPDGDRRSCRALLSGRPRR
mmetsp:Transcript_108265/g.323782  ORF Transcript_108265/g.323782 Transcript_108265/m.323782 type:complete len:211 (+) Transcript_108265:327-959(+)